MKQYQSHKNTHIHAPYPCISENGSEVTLVLAFGFLPQNFGSWWVRTNGTLL